MITVLVTVSRPECVALVFENLNRLEWPKQEMELLVMVDNPEIKDFYYPEGPFKEVKVVKMDRPAPPRLDWKARRQRIADVHNRARKEVSTESTQVFGFEDDAVLPADTLTKLWGHRQKGIEKPGIVSGVQVGRWGSRYWGAWDTNDPQFPDWITSLHPTEGLQEVDATGLYCFLVDSWDYRFAHFGEKDPVGPDVWFGFRLKMQGKHNFVDTSLRVGHWTPRGVIYPDNKDPILTLDKTPKGWIITRTESSIKE